MAEPENMTLVLLREVRAEFRTELGSLRGELQAMNRRLDAMHLNGTKALKSFIGHRTMVERTVASFEDQVTQLEARVKELEARP